MLSPFLSDQMGMCLVKIWQIKTNIYELIAFCSELSVGNLFIPWSDHITCSLRKLSSLILEQSCVNKGD